MCKILLALVAILMVSPAYADFTAKDASAVTITFKNPNTCSSIACVPIFQMTDGAGAAVGVTGSPLFINFGTGVTLPAFAATPTFNCGTGCFQATQPVSAVSLPLPSGAATAANQSTEIGSLSTIVTNTASPPPLGTAGGWTPTGKAAITNAAVTIKSAAGQLGFAICDNNNSAATYLQLFDATSPTVGTNVGFLPLPPNLTGGYTLSLVGLQFSNSIKVAATTTPGGSTAPATAINCTFGFN